MRNRRNSVLRVVLVDFEVGEKLQGETIIPRELSDEHAILIAQGILFAWEFKAGTKAYKVYRDLFLIFDGNMPSTFGANVKQEMLRPLAKVS